MSKSQHVLIAGSDLFPMIREWQRTGKTLSGGDIGAWPDRANTPDEWYGGTFEICGCCGARYAPDVEKFNATFAKSDMYVWQNQANTYNRGVLVGLNLPINGIKDTPGTVVEHIQCGDDVVSLRLRMKQVYGD